MLKNDSRTPLIAGNWKMQGSLASIKALAEGIKAGVVDIDQVEWAVFPPAVYLALVESLLANTKVAWGGQNVSDQPEGAYTGEISASMLNDFHCKYVLVGHSERRHLYGEDNAIVAAKFVAAVEAGLTPILCVGETLAQREADETRAVVEAQVGVVLDLISQEKPASQDGLISKDVVRGGSEGRTGVYKSANEDSERISNEAGRFYCQPIIAYEPVWAIGTGKSATPDQAQDVHAHIRQYCATRDEALAKNLRILYGGSLKPENADALFAMPDIDGGLIGGASLKADSFLKIGELCSKYY